MNNLSTSFREPRIIAYTTTGQPVIVDIHGLTEADFKGLLKNTLLREDISKESREKIIKILNQ